MCKIVSPVEEVGPILTLTAAGGQTFRQALERERKDPPSPLQIRGFLDTGCDGIAVDAGIVEALRVPGRSYTRILTVKGYCFPRIFFLDLTIDFEEKMVELTDIPCAAVTNLRKNLGFDALIGRSLLDFFVFTLDGPKKTFILDYPPGG